MTPKTAMRIPYMNLYKREILPCVADLTWQVGESWKAPRAALHSAWPAGTLTLPASRHLNSFELNQTSH
jgi:hypothetical protein